jgi:TfoX C-terminal domain
VKPSVGPVDLARLENRKDATMPRQKRALLKPQTPVEELWNLSALTSGWLREQGISTHQELARADLFELWLALRLKHSQVTRLMYYALWGAKHDCHWNKIPLLEKKKFDERLAALKKRRKP